MFKQDAENVAIATPHGKHLYTQPLSQSDLL